MQGNLMSTRRERRHCTWCNMITEQSFGPPFCLQVRQPARKKKKNHHISSYKTRVKLYRYTLVSLPMLFKRVLFWVLPVFCPYLLFTERSYESNFLFKFRPGCSVVSAFDKQVTILLRTADRLCENNLDGVEHLLMSLPECLTVLP